MTTESGNRYASCRQAKQSERRELCDVKKNQVPVFGMWERKHGIETNKSNFLATICYGTTILA